MNKKKRKKNYKNHKQSPAYKRKNQIDQEMTFKDTFFFQVTACGIITLGLFVLVMLSPNATSIRDVIASTIQNRDFFYTGGLFNYLPNRVNHVQDGEQLTEDFRIDEALLDDVAFRNQ